MDKIKMSKYIKQSFKLIKIWSINKKTSLWSFPSINELIWNIATPHFHKNSGKL